MRILVTGALGQLGTTIRNYARKLDETNDYFYTDIVGNNIDVYPLDITKKDDVSRYINDNNIDLTINCAAYTNVEKAESHEIDAYELNGLAPQYIAKEMKNRNGWMIQISTDYVFGVEPYNTPCDENRKGTPLGVYGNTKKIGEKNIIATNCKHIIIRTSWLYSEYGKNFMKAIINKVNDNTNPIKVVDDQIGTPTYAKDLAETIITIVKRIEDNKDDESIVGIYNYSNEGVCSWYDFAYEISREYASYKKNYVVPCKSSEFESKVKRPSYSVLDKSKIKRVFNIEIPHWRKSLELCISKYKIIEITDRFNDNLLHNIPSENNNATIATWKDTSGYTISY